MRWLALVLATVPSGCFVGGDRPGKAHQEETTGSETSSSTTTETTSPAECGNGIVEGDEACDDGNDVEGDGCNPDCVESGTVLWSDHFTGAAHGPDEARAVAIDTDGNLVIAGKTWMGEFGSIYEGNTDIWVRKYDSLGELLWERTHASEAGAPDAANCVAIDTTNDIFVAGYEGAEERGGDAWLRKYGPDGNVQWTSTHDGLAPETGDVVNVSPDRVNDCVSDAAGGLLVTGRLAVEHDSIRSFWLARYDAAGSLLWSTLEGTDIPSEQGLAVALDSTGRVFATGATMESAVVVDAFFRSYDLEGNLVWSASMGADEDPYTRVGGSDIAVTADGDVIVAGFFEEWVLQDDGSSFVPFAAPRLWRFTPDGTMVWDGWPGVEDPPPATYDAYEAEIPYTIAVDGGGIVVLTGLIAAPHGVDRDLDIYVAKISPEGRMLWERTFAGTAHLYDAARGVAMAPSGELLVVGVETVVFEERDGWIARLAP